MRAAACLAVVVCLGGSVVGCGDDDGDSAVTTVTKLIGAEGGTVELPNGGKVEIPAGALSAEVSIKITKHELDDVAALPSNLEASGKPYSFEPHGTVFDVPVKIEVPFDGDASEVRPMKLPNEDAATSEWTTVFPNEKAGGKVSMETTSFSVILAARPRRGSGVVTLPDGAVLPDDAGVAGAGGAGGDAGTAGTGGAGGDAGTAGTGGAGGDAGTGGAMASCIGAPAQVTGIDPAGEMFSTADTVLVASGGTLVTGYAGSGTSFTSAGPVMTFDAPETFATGSVSVRGSVIAVGTSRGGVATTGRLHIGREDTPGNFSYLLYDLSSYQEYYTAAAPGGPFAFNPYFGPVVAGDNRIVANERAAGSLIVFSPTTGEPLGFLTTGDLNTSPLSGVVAMHIQGDFLVAAINRTGLGIDPVNAIRTFNISDPSNIMMVDELVRTGIRPYAMIYDPRGRYLVSNLNGAEISTFTVDGTGNISAETVLATTRAGAQARGIVLVGNKLVVGNPDFTVQPTDSAVSVFDIGDDGSLTFYELVDLPDVPSSDESYSIFTQGGHLYTSGTVTHAIDFTMCAPET